MATKKWINFAATPTATDIALAAVVSRLSNESPIGSFDSLFDLHAAIRAAAGTESISGASIALISHSADQGVLKIDNWYLRAGSFSGEEAYFQRAGDIMSALGCNQLYLLGCETSSGLNSTLALPWIYEAINKGRSRNLIDVFGATTLVSYEMFDDNGFSDLNTRWYTTHALNSSIIHAQRELFLRKWVTDGDPVSWDAVALQCDNAPQSLTGRARHLDSLIGKSPSFWLESISSSEPVRRGRLLSIPDNSLQLGANLVINVHSAGAVLEIIDNTGHSNDAIVMTVRPELRGALLHI